MTEEIKTKCPECRGNKLIMGAGYIEHKCPYCSGTGWFTEIIPHIHLPSGENLVTSVKEALKDDSHETKVFVPIKRKGRPPKVKP
jgi:phage FluMu protein Com